MLIDDEAAEGNEDDDEESDEDFTDEESEFTEEKQIVPATASSAVQPALTAWCSPVSTSGLRAFTSSTIASRNVNGGPGLISSSAKYNVRQGVRNGRHQHHNEHRDGHSKASAGFQPRCSRPAKSAPADKGQLFAKSELAPMLLLGYTDDVEHLSNLEMGKCNTLDLISRMVPAAAGKSLCINKETMFYKIAPNSKISLYVPPSTKKEPKAKALRDVLNLGWISKVGDSELVNVHGIVMSTTQQTPMKFSVGAKIVLASVMFF